MANVGSIDRVLRFLVGLGLLIGVFVPQAAVFESFGEWKYLVAVVGVVLVATAAFRFCPAYTLFGIRT